MGPVPVSSAGNQAAAEEDQPATQPTLMCWTQLRPSGSCRNPILRRKYLVWRGGGFAQNAWHQQVAERLVDQTFWTENLTISIRMVDGAKADGWCPNPLPPLWLAISTTSGCRPPPASNQGASRSVVSRLCGIKACDHRGKRGQSRSVWG